MKLVDVHSGNVEQTGFFCMMSKKKSDGYQKNGVFQIVYNGTLLSYHYLLRKDLERKLDEAGQWATPRAK
jgi:hypothetical protein